MPRLRREQKSVAPRINRITATKRAHPSSYETHTMYLPSLNGNKVPIDQVDKFVKVYEPVDGWVEHQVGKHKCWNKIIVVPPEKILIIPENPRYAKKAIHDEIEGNETENFTGLDAAEAFRMSKQMALDILRDRNVWLLIDGYIESRSFLDPLEVLPRTDGMFDSWEGNCRTTVSYLFSGLLKGEPELEEILPRDLLDKINEALLLIEFPGQITCRVWKGVDSESLQHLLSIHHNGGKVRWPVVVQALQMFKDFESLTGQKWPLRRVSDLKKLRRALVDKKNLAFVKQAGARCRKKQDEVRWRIMAFAACIVYTVLYESDGTRDTLDKFDTFHRFYRSTNLRDACDGAELYVKGKDGHKKFSDYRNPDLEKDFLGWLAEGRIHDTIQVVHLANVLADNDIRETLFLKGNVEDHDFFGKCTRAVALKQGNSVEQLLQDLDSLETLVRGVNNAKPAEFEKLTTGRAQIERIRKGFERMCCRMDG